MFNLSNLQPNYVELKHIKFFHAGTPDQGFRASGPQPPVLKAEGKGSREGM